MREPEAHERGDSVEQAAGAGGEHGTLASAVRAGAGEAEDLAPPRIERRPESSGRFGTGGERGPGERHPPRFADRRRPARQRHRPQVGHTLESGEVGHEKLTAPYRPVRPIPEPVERDPSTLPVCECSAMHEAMWAWWCCTGHGSTSSSQGVLGGQVLRVQVVRDHLRFDPEEPAEVDSCLQERLIGGEVLEIADVVAAYESRLLRHRHRVLQLGADGEHLAVCRPGSANASGA